MPFSTATLIILCLWVVTVALIVRNIQLRRKLKRAQQKLAEKPRVVHVPGEAEATPAPDTAPRVEAEARADTLPPAHRQLLAKLDLPSGSLPVGGDWRIGDDTLLLLVDHIFETRPDVVVECGTGLSTAALARALDLNGHGQLYSIEHDAAFIDDTIELVTRLELGANVTLIEAPLDDYGPSGKWYERGGLSRLPQKIDLLLIAGPPLFSGKAPRYPAGPELFGRLSRDGLVLLDDVGRAKQQKVLRMWASEFPEFTQQPTDTVKQAVILRRNGDVV
ncbi:class I SAM-dependent methyltransferase [Rhodobacteraceae bacterium NNCM2]|nr:class I SAM-dependent methyltransferase [Coraliihabitans acroporae]